MGTPSQSQNQRKNSGIYLGPTRGKSSPKNSRRGCLCLDTPTYDVKCCNGALMQQGIGNIQSPNRTGGGGFSDGYDEGFEQVNQ
jgi:hypothetical protein